MIFCFVPSAIFETLAWRWAYRLSPDLHANASNQDGVVTDTHLPTLVGNASACNSGTVKPQRSCSADLEAAISESGDLHEGERIAVRTSELGLKECAPGF